MKKIKLKLSADSVKGFFTLVSILYPSLESSDKLNLIFMKSNLFSLHRMLQLKQLNLKHINSLSIDINQSMCLFELKSFGIESNLTGKFDFELSVYRQILREIEQQVVNM